jgi:hypothetical protein
LAAIIVRGADLEHLQDVRRVAGAVRGDRRRHRFRIAALVDGVDLVVALALVKRLVSALMRSLLTSGLRVPPTGFPVTALSSRSKPSMAAASATRRRIEMRCDIEVPPLGMGLVT